jgi:ABC-2 type transport system permease protein
VGKGDLLRKINFPRYIIILAISFSALINLILNFIVLAVFMMIEGVPLTPGAFIMAPLILELYILSIGVGFFLSALFVRFRDISYIWEVMMQAGFYGTPILYALNDLPIRLQQILILNPMAQIIQDARHVLVGPYATTIQQIYDASSVWLIPIGVTLVIAVLSIAYFKSRSKFFAEDV